MVPDWKVACKITLRSLEFPELKGIVFMQTACQAVQHQRGRRYLFCIISLFMVQDFFPLREGPLLEREGEGIHYFHQKGLFELIWHFLLQ